MLPMTPSRQGNLHPAVVNRSGGSASPSRTAIGGTIDVDEAEARTRAREILQDFVKHKNRAEEVESQLQRALMENERLSHLLQETKTELALAKERSTREIDNIKSEKRENENRIEAAQEEVRKVAQSFAQRAADGAAQLRLKEQEVEQLEQELRRTKEEVRTLRKDAIRAQGAGQSNEESERTHQRVVELARRCLDAERDKERLELSILDDRKHYQQAIRTIEALRKQCADAEERTSQAYHQKKELEDRHQMAIAALHKEMDMQRDLYKTFMQQMGAAGSPMALRLTSSGDVGALSPVGRSGAGGSGAPGSLETQLALAEQRLHSTEKQMALLKEQLDSAIAARREANETLYSEKTKHAEVLSRLQSQILTIEHDLDVSKQHGADLRAASEKDRSAYQQLQAVHESLKADFSRQSAEVSRALTQLEDVHVGHHRLLAQVAELQEQVRVRESACDVLNSALASRRTLEEEIRQLKAHHAHEMELQRVQHLSALKLASNQSGGNAADTTKAYHAATNMFEVSREASDSLYQRMSQVDEERRQWHREKEHLLHEAKLDKEAAQNELNALQRALEEARVEAAERRAEATHAMREVAEWRSAFSVSEKTRNQLQDQLDSMRDEIYGVQKEKSAAEVRQNMYSQHIQRLESQGDRDRQEVFRLRRLCGTFEVALARKDVEFTNYKLRQQQSLLSDPNKESNFDVEKEIISLRVEKEKSESTLREKEIGLQQLHEEHLAAVGRHAAPPMMIDGPLSLESATAGGGAGSTNDAMPSPIPSGARSSLSAAPSPPSAYYQRSSSTTTPMRQQQGSTGATPQSPALPNPPPNTPQMSHSAINMFSPPPGSSPSNRTPESISLPAPAPTPANNYASSASRVSPKPVSSFDDLEFDVVDTGVKTTSWGPAAASTKPPQSREHTPPPSESGVVTAKW